MKIKNKLDKLGIALNALCLLHCIALPLLSLGLNLEIVGASHNHSHSHTEWTLEAILFIATFIILWRVARKERKGIKAWVGFSFLLLMVGHWLQQFYPQSLAITYASLISLTLFHIRNIRLRLKSRCTTC